MNISSKLELKIRIFISCYDSEQLYQYTSTRHMFRLVSLHREYNKNSFENGKRKNRATSNIHVKEEYGNRIYLII